MYLFLTLGLRVLALPFGGGTSYKKDLDIKISKPKNKFFHAIVIKLTLLCQNANGLTKLKCEKSRAVYGICHAEWRGGNAEAQSFYIETQRSVGIVIFWEGGGISFTEAALDTAVAESAAGALLAGWMVVLWLIKLFVWNLHAQKIMQAKLDRFDHEGHT